MGEPTRLKMLRKVGLVVIGGQGQDFVVKYGFDYSTNLSGVGLSLSDTGTASEYNIAEYAIGEYSGGTVAEAVSVNVGGSGKVVQLGFEADINGNPLSIQKIDISLLAGKVII